MTAVVAVAGLACLAPAALADTVVHVQGREYLKGAPDPVLDTFTWIVTVDNAKNPLDPNPLNHPGLGGTESNSPTVATGDETDDTTPPLPAGRYLVTVRSPEHKMWGRHIVVHADGTVTANVGLNGGPVLANDRVRVSLRPWPIPEGVIKVYAFADTAWTNNAPDDAEVGIPNMNVHILDQLHQQVTVDGNGDPICGGHCRTDADGFVVIPHMLPGTYFAEVVPPTGSGWIQNSTFDGGPFVMLGVEEGSDGSGAPAEQLWLPPAKRTMNTFGFVKLKDWPNNNGTGSIRGTAKNEVGWPPNELVTLGQPVAEPYVALSDNTTDEQVYTGQGNKDGTFTIPRVPAGGYTLAVWDEQLDYIITFMNVDVSSGEQVNLDALDNNADGLPDGGFPVPRWFGWLEGNVYNDNGGGDPSKAGNGVRDPGEPAIPNTDVDERWRDGSIKDATMTDRNGHYSYTEAEGGPLGKWFIGEVGFSRFSTTGANYHPDRAFNLTGNPNPPTDVTFGTDGPGGGLLTAQNIAVGHYHDVDFGKQVYPEGTPGQIVGVVYHGTTRNEVNARFQGHEDYEPGIPGVTVLLKNKAGQVLNDYQTDHWEQPTDCSVFTSGGRVADPLSSDLPFNPLIPSKCIESPLLSGLTKDAAFDGGYAFTDMCPAGTYPCDDSQKVPLTPGDYVAQVLMPNDANGDAIYRITREEDVNVDNGPDFVAPAIPPPPCVGPDHVVSGAIPRAKTNGKHRRLCDERLVTLKQKQNANADFYIFTATDVEIPGRAIGLVTNDVALDNNQQSLWWLNKRPESVPIGIYDRDPAVGGRLIKTIQSDENGQYDVELPSTETINCPTPQGICPGMYWFVVNDPGTKAHPNTSYNPSLLSEGSAWDIWPGQTTQLDTPVIGIASAGGCALPTTTPDLMQVSKPYVTPSESGSARDITLQGANFGATAGTVTLGTTTLSTGNGGIQSWGDNQIVIRVPTASSSFVGQKQLQIHGSTGDVSPVGLTFHVLRSSGGGTQYNPPVVTVAAPSTNAHALQDAIDGAAAGSLLVLHKGQYLENVILNKRLMIQGSGPGGQIAIGGADVTLPGTTLDGKFFNQNAQAWQARLAGMTWVGNQAVQSGAGITVLAPTTSAFGTGTNARIDGLSIHTGIGDGAGGIQVNAYARNLQITNNILEGNQGGFAGAVALGTSYLTGSNKDNQNDDITIRYNRIEGNTGATKSGGIGIFNGANGYEVVDNRICANFSFEYGGGVSHYGSSPGGVISRNLIVYNEAANSQGGSGGAVSLSGEVPNGGGIGDGSGSLTVERNLMQGNMAGDDGGAMFIQQGLNAQIDIRNNMITNNAAADTGGAILLDDSANVRIVHDTIARNATTGTSETRDGQRHAAGVAIEPNETGWTPSRPTVALPVGRYSPPRSLFNDIFNENRAYTYGGPPSVPPVPATPPALTDAGLLDFEVVGFPTARLSPIRSILSTGDAVNTPAPANPTRANLIGVDPLFTASFPTTFTITGQRTNPNFVSVTINRPNAPQDLLGDHHIGAGSPAINAGLASFDLVTPPSTDYDGQPRPNTINNRPDLGADER